MTDIKKAIKMAIEMEQKGYDLYMKAAEKTSNRLGKTTLEAIAAKELDHIKAIEEFKRKMAGEVPNLDKAIGSINPKKKIDYIRPIMENLRSELGKQSGGDADLEKAYKVAMGLEQESFNLYKKLASSSRDPQAKKFFEFLMGEENTHYELLQDTLQYLNNPDEWFKQQERWIVEG
jgi:rubrerythrin